MKTSTILSICLVVSFVIGSIIDIYFIKKRKKLTKELNDLLFNKQFKEYDDLLANNTMYFKAFNFQMLRLQKEMATNNYAEVVEICKKTNEAKLNENQSIMINNIAFNYFMSNKHYTDAKKALEHLAIYKDKNIYKECLMLYEIFVEKTYKYIEKLESELNEADDVKINRYLFLLSEMYKNKNDIKTANEYLNKYQKEANLN